MSIVSQLQLLIVVIFPPAPGLKEQPQSGEFSAAMAKGKKAMTSDR